MTTMLLVLLVVLALAQIGLLGFVVWRVRRPPELVELVRHSLAQRHLAAGTGSGRDRLRARLARKLTEKPAS